MFSNYVYRVEYCDKCCFKEETEYLTQGFNLRGGIEAVDHDQD